MAVKKVVTPNASGDWNWSEMRYAAMAGERATSGPIRVSLTGEAKSILARVTVGRSAHRLTRDGCVQSSLGRSSFGGRLPTYCMVRSSGAILPICAIAGVVGAFGSTMVRPRHTYLPIFATAVAVGAFGKSMVRPLHIYSPMLDSRYW